MKGSGGRWKSPLIQSLPEYVFSTVDKLKKDARIKGEDIIDLGMGNPDRPTPGHIVEKLIESSGKPRNHRYSASAGITNLRKAVCDWYERRFNVKLNPDREAVATMGIKEGISHLMPCLLSAGDSVIVPVPAYPIHPYSVTIAGGKPVPVPLVSDTDTLIGSIEKAVRKNGKKVKAILVSFPNNPTTQTVNIDFFEKIVDLAREAGILIIHDFAYAELCFDGTPPSIMQVKGAKEVAVEFYSLSKTYNMPGWRVGFMVGNPEIVAHLKKIKSYLDYGIFQPIQIASILAMNGSQKCVDEVRETYRSRRDKLIKSFAKANWEIEPPSATMFVWAKIPEQFEKMGSLEFSKMLVKKAGVVSSPGVGFGKHGEGFVRFALVENEKRIGQAARNLDKTLGKR
ncbi:MAG: aminotransferase class I/II-fold pyridoxal phosphate-dependent enzyme [Candidatus Mycalebacterium zealandia]|nr:MAG: aminotransferase class I/II-fold pyridoxal phosphate-dependent enzyme [Candidatus Mycalebacterium zealandia]